MKRLEKVNIIQKLHHQDKVFQIKRRLPKWNNSNNQSLTSWERALIVRSIKNTHKIIIIKESFQTKEKKTIVEIHHLKYSVGGRSSLTLLPVFKVAI